VCAVDIAYLRKQYQKFLKSGNVLSWAYIAASLNLPKYVNEAEKVQQLARTCKYGFARLKLLFEVKSNLVFWNTDWPLTTVSNLINEEEREQLKQDFISKFLSTFKRMSQDMWKLK